MNIQATGMNDYEIDRPRDTRLARQKTQVSTDYNKILMLLHLLEISLYTALVTSFSISNPTIEPLDSFVSQQDQSKQRHMFQVDV